MQFWVRKFHDLLWSHRSIQLCYPSLSWPTFGTGKCASWITYYGPPREVHSMLQYHVHAQNKYSLKMSHVSYTKGILSQYCWRRGLYIMPYIKLLCEFSNFVKKYNRPIIQAEKCTIKFQAMIWCMYFGLVHIFKAMPHNVHICM